MMASVRSTQNAAIFALPLNWIIPPYPLGVTDTTMDQQDPKAQIQKLNDMLQLATNQLSNANNECRVLGAEVIALRREIAELKKAKEASAVPASAPNGHAHPADEARA
jgi:peptidoglycan hydrolase CwlO-like protein